MAEKFDLARYPLHLGLGASAVPQPEFAGGMEWYADYERRNAADDAEGRLVALHSFDENWTSWEMHPVGSEVVLCIAGSITLIQESEAGSQSSVTIGAGEYAINPPGIWHTADVAGEATAVFITAGKGTQHRPR